MLKTRFIAVSYIKCWNSNSDNTMYSSQGGGGGLSMGGDHAIALAFFKTPIRDRQMGPC